MKTGKTHYSSGIGRTLLGALALMVIALVSPQTVEAELRGTAGNAVIRNTVTVTYADANNNMQTPIERYIDVTVDIIDVAPTVLAIAGPGSTDGVGTTETYDVTIRTNSNGPGTINLAAADGSPDNITVGAVPTINGGASIVLGATIIDPSDGNGAQDLANGADVTFAVPNDGAESVNGVINDLEENDTVYLTDGTTFWGPFTVGTVSDPLKGDGATAATGSIVLINASGGNLTFTPEAGWMIVESKTVTLTVTQGVVTNPADPASWETTVTANMGALTSPGSTVTTNAGMVLLSVTKEVSTNGTDFAATAVAAPEGRLTYRITVTNNGTGNATNVVISDPTPQFTTYVGESAKTSSTVEDTYADGSDLTDADDVDDSYQNDGDTAIFDVGTIAPAASVLLFFQVDID